MHSRCTAKSAPSLDIHNSSTMRGGAVPPNYSTSVFDMIRHTDADELHNNASLFDLGMSEINGSLLGVISPM